MAQRRSHIALIHKGLTKELVYYNKDFTIEALVFLSMNDRDAKYEITETAWQDRAEWVSKVPFRTYVGWERDDVITMEDMLKDSDVINIYVDY